MMHGYPVHRYYADHMQLVLAAESPQCLHVAHGSGTYMPRACLHMHAWMAGWHGIRRCVATVSVHQCTYHHHWPRCAPRCGSMPWWHQGRGRIRAPLECCCCGYLTQQHVPSCVALQCYGFDVLQNTVLVPPKRCLERQLHAGAADGMSTPPKSRCSCWVWQHLRHSKAPSEFCCVCPRPGGALGVCWQGDIDISGMLLLLCLPSRRAQLRLEVR
jgi:hypothetical protein